MTKTNTLEILKNYRFYKARRCIIENELSSVKKADNPIGESSLNSLEKLETELTKIRYLIEIIDEALKMAGDYNERYKIIIEARFINNVSIEDISEMIHISRSRCYELHNEAIEYLTRILFGDADMLYS